MPPCTVCSHPERYAIDRALLTSKATYESLSRRYGPSTSALYRHRRHLQENISQARQRLKNNLSLGFLFKLNNFLARTENASRKAEAEDNVDQVLKASRVGNRIIRDLSKMDVPWDADTVYRLMASPQWTGQDILLPTDPAFLATGHQTLADTFFQPCPEPPPSPDLKAGDEAVNVGRESKAHPAVTGATVDSLASHPTLASLPPELLADLHPDLLATLLDTLSPPPDPATRAPRQRDMSAKSAPKSRSTTNFNKLNQHDKSAKKSTAKKPQISPLDGPPEGPAAPGHQPVPDPLKHESLLERLRRKWAPTPVTAPSSRAADTFAPDYFQEEIAPGYQAGLDAVDPESEASPDVPGKNEPPAAVSTESAAHPAATFLPPAEESSPETTPAPGPAFYSALSPQSSSLHPGPPSPVPSPPPDPGPPSPVPGPLFDPDSPTTITKEEYASLNPQPNPNPPDPNQPLNPFTHPADYWFAVTHGYRRDNPPKHIPDRRWHDDFGSPRRIKGTY